jgi:hypothetical protein
MNWWRLFIEPAAPLFTSTTAPVSWVGAEIIGLFCKENPNQNGLIPAVSDILPEILLQPPGTSGTPRIPTPQTQTAGPLFSSLRFESFRFHYLSAPCNTGSLATEMVVTIYAVAEVFSRRLGKAK